MHVSVGVIRTWSTLFIAHLPFTSHGCGKWVNIMSYEMVWSTPAILL
jgi:hypothetical protein